MVLYTASKCLVKYSRHYDSSRNVCLKYTLSKDYLQTILLSFFLRKVCNCVRINSNEWGPDTTLIYPNGSQNVFENFPASTKIPFQWKFFGNNLYLLEGITKNIFCFSLLMKNLCMQNIVSKRIYVYGWDYNENDYLYLPKFS